MVREKDKDIYFSMRFYWDMQMAVQSAALILSFTEVDM